MFTVHYLKDMYNNDFKSNKYCLIKEGICNYDFQLVVKPSIIMYSMYSRTIESNKINRLSGKI